MINLSQHWEEACRFLREREPVFAVLIDRFEGQKLQVTGLNPFQTLANSIVGQQISVKAASSIWARFQSLVGEVIPQNVLALSPETLCTAGLSNRKAQYIQGIAQAFASGAIDPRLWPQQSDEEVLKSLVTLRGIGRWTAEMFLIFHLGRADVLPVDDLGLLKSASQLFGWPVEDSAAKLIPRAEDWRPWRTAATWYLWRNLDPEPVAY